MHFRVFVVTRTNEESELETTMKPFHEYESTGSNAYVTGYDNTDDAQKDLDKYWKPEEESLKDYLDGELCGDDVYTEDEFAKLDIVKLTNGYCIISNDGTKLIKQIRFTNPNSQWDYYSEVEFMKDIHHSADERCSCIKKSDFDMQWWEKWMLKDRTDDYNEIKPYLTSDYMPLTEFKLKHPDDNKLAREEYWNQPVIKKMKEDKVYVYSLDIDEVYKSKDFTEFARSYLEQNPPFYALVDKDQQWIEHVNGNNWRIEFNGKKETFEENWYNLFNAIPDDYYIWACDCHI